MGEGDRDLVKEALARAQRRGEREKPIPPLAIHAMLGILLWFAGSPLWAQIGNGLLWAWTEFGARRLETERRMEVISRGKLLEKLRWELVRRARAMEVSWPWHLAPRMATAIFIIVVFGLTLGNAWLMGLTSLLTWGFSWLDRKRDRKLLAMEFAALERWERKAQQE